MARASVVAVTVALAAALPATAGASTAKRPWPPIPRKGTLHVHYGEEHVGDPDGPRILGKVIRQTARYRPALVATSGDKGDDNAVETLTRWKEMMSLYERRGIPYFAAVGNHDRSPEGSQGIGSALNGGSIANYQDIFADRPYPFGDAAPPDDPRFAPASRPASDPPGASTHYALEFGRVRYVFLDNSCFSFVNCDPYQNPPFGSGESSYDFLAAEAAAANAAGQLLFVVMHIPTRDDRPEHTEPTPNPHTMGEGTSPDNAAFEQAAAAAGVDAVLVGHVKGMWQHVAEGVPYYTDGGAGGEVYVGDAEETGVDYGYWHGYRLITVRKGRIVHTDAVPVFTRDGIEIKGPAKVKAGATAEFSAAGRQPTVDGANVVLELRDPDPGRPNAAALPTPSRLWRTGDRDVLAPVAATSDDPRRNPRVATTSGRFRARCPGRTTITIKSGWERAQIDVTVVGGKRPRHGRRPSCRGG